MAAGATTSATTGGFGCIIAGSSLATVGTCVHETASNNGMKIVARFTRHQGLQRACTCNTTLSRRNESVITLMLPLKLDEIEIATGVAIWVIAADLWTSLINRTAAFALIKEHAH